MTEDSTTRFLKALAAAQAYVTSGQNRRDAAKLQRDANLAMLAAGKKPFEDYAAMGIAPTLENQRALTDMSGWSQETRTAAILTDHWERGRDPIRQIQANEAEWDLFCAMTDEGKLRYIEHKFSNANR